mmetsp:Transcript_39107/g.59652  ORF Transcript_39107/g.59652 Transcript_39107/m.59652 type:complete len:87 (-) Transcript_39107:158-418(-)
MEGVGLNLVSKNLESAVIDGAIKATDREALLMMNFLKEKDGLEVGLSSGANFVAAVKAALALGPGATVVTIICDGRSNYQSKLGSL